MGTLLTTERLTLRDWTQDDGTAALAIYGTDEVARWLTPAMARIRDESEMRAVLDSWAQSQYSFVSPLGRWAVTDSADGRVVGGVSLRRLPPEHEDVEIGWQLAPSEWGKGYATEAGRGLAAWAFEQGAHELFAVVRPSNRRGAETAQRIGMQWVGVTEKHYGLELQVYRLWPADLTRPGR